MALVGVSITKSVQFRGVQQEFSNVYYYWGDLPVIAAEANSLIDQLVTTEKKLHSSAVAFLFGRCWSAGGSRESNNMIVQKPLSGFGNFATIANLDRERAYLVRWRAGINSRGKPVYLRKWYHSCGAPSGVTINDGILANTEQLSSASRGTIVTLADESKLRSTALQSYSLRSERNRPITGDTECHPYLEHHQLGDMWRA